MNVKHFIKNDYVFSILSKIVGVLTGVIYVALFSRYFGVELKGESAIILNYIAILSIVFDCGFNQSYAFFRRKDKEYKSKYLKLVRRLFLVFGILAIGLILISSNATVRICCSILPIRILTNQINNVIMIETPKKRNYSSIILNCLDVILVLLLWIVIVPTKQVLLAFLLVKEIVYLLLGITVLGKDFFKTTKENIQMFPLVKFGISTMICLLMMEINYRIDVIMLEGHTSVYNIGLYSVAVSLAERVWLIPDAIRDILMSKLVKGKTEQEVAKVTRISMALSIFLVLLIVIFGKILIQIMFGKDYLEAYNITIIVMLGVLSMVFYKTIYAFYNIIGKQHMNVAILTSSALLNIVGNACLIPRFHIYGAALASIISYSFCGLVYLFSFSQNTDIPIKEICLISRSDIKLMDIFTHKQQN